MKRWILIVLAMACMTGAVSAQDGEAVRVLYLWSAPFYEEDVPFEPDALRGALPADYALWVYGEEGMDAPKGAEMPEWEAAIWCDLDGLDALPPFDVIVVGPCMPSDVLSVGRDSALEKTMPPYEALAEDLFEKRPETTFVIVSPPPPPEDIIRPNEQLYATWHTFITEELAEGRVNAFIYDPYAEGNAGLAAFIDEKARGKVLEDFESESDFLLNWWVYAESRADVFVCERVANGVGAPAEGGYAMRVTFDIPAANYPGCGTDFYPIRDWREQSGIRLTWRGDPAGIPIKMVLLVEIQTTGDVIPFEAPVETPGTDWAESVLTWDAFTRADWLGEGEPEAVDLRHIVGMSFSFGQAEQDQAGVIWIDEVRLAP